MPEHRHIRIPVLGKAAPPIGSDFVSLEAASGIVLLLAAVAALVWANTAGASYVSFWGHNVTLGTGDLAITENLEHWVNDALMTVFFFVVGLEIKRELVTGELRDRSRAALPAVAAVGGMLVPALVYVAVNAGGDGAKGWAVPMATDIAFALGLLAVLGSRVPRGLKLFLLTLAIVDDIGAIVVIALFYAKDVEPLWLGAALLTALAVVAMSRAGVNHPILYLLPGALLWLCLHEAGVEPTLAGVALGLLTPARPRGGVPVLERLENGLHPVSSFVIVPLFALANAGVALGGGAIGDALSSRITVGIVAGLVVGKFVGILGASALAVRLRVGRLPDGIAMRHVAGVAALGGIGFTVSLFVTDLAFRGGAIADAKIGVLVASAVAAILGLTMLAVMLRPARERVPGNPMKIVALVSDLMDRSRVSSALDAVVFTGEPGACAGADVVVIDLARHGASVAAARVAAPHARVVAFGPHVDDALLEQARRDGADVVLARSRFFQDPAAAIASP